MKKALLMIIIYGLLIFQHNAYAEPIAVTEELEESLNNLDTKEIEALLRSLNSEVSEFIPEFSLKDFISIVKQDGSGYDVRAIINGMVKYFFRETILNSRLLIKLIVLAVVLAVLRNLQTAFENDTVGKLSYCVCSLVLIGIAITSFNSVLSVAKQAINDMVNFMQALLPMLLSLLISIGGVTSAAVFHPVIYMSVSFVSTLIKDILLPMIFLSAVLAIVNNITQSLQVSKLAGLLKDICISVLGILLSFFIGVLVVQGAATSVADGITVRTAKFATKNFIPLVGGIFSDALDTVIGCSLLLKNAVGLMGVIVVFMICAFPAIKILSVMIIYRLAGALVEPMGDSQLVKTLNDMSNSMIMIFVSVVAVALMFFISITIVIGAGNITVMMR
jgi:stage III sporulation protein AE